MRLKLIISSVWMVLLALNQVQAQEIRLNHVQDYTANFNFPTDLVGNSAGDVFVMDGMNDRIVVLKKSGQVTEINPQGDTFYKAVGLAMIDGKLWIADTPRSRLLQIEENGRIRQVIRLSHDIEPVDLVGVADHIALTDRVAHTISVLDKSGKEKYYWGKRGNGMGEFINPGFIAVGPENRLVIGDILNRRVVSFVQSGRYPQIIAKPGIEEGQIFRPKGIALDKQQRVWIADGYTGAIQVFSMTGQYQGVAVKQAGETIALSSPMGLWFDDQERLWVVESFGNKVSLWKVQK